MAYTQQSYRIEEIFLLEEGNLVIGLNASNTMERDEWQKKSIEDLKSDFNNKDILIVKLDDLKVSILAVDVMNSIANFKNVFLQIENSNKAQLIKLKDEVNII